MKNLAISTSTLPYRTECQAAAWGGLVGAAVFALAIAALEAWLRVPVQPVLERYLQVTLSRAASIADAIFRRTSF